jgi:E3 ubiquitin-protein ligase MYCBP2
MVTTEDQVVFCFKSSRRANNGTDVNGGQIPQILYRVIVPESQTPSRQLDQMEPVYHLSKSFSKTVTKECFESLLALLQWSWNTFKAGLIDVTHVSGTQNHMIAVLDLERLVFISRASLRLLRTYTNELYPNELITKKLPTENTQLATCIGDVRSLLRQILSDTLPHLKRTGKSRKRDTGTYTKMITEILQEAHQTFVSCFHAFYPTASLRWSSLCHLLGEMEKLGPQSSLDRLLSAVLASLCHPAVRLRSTFPILGVLEHTTLPLPKESHPPPSYSSSSSPDSSSPSSSTASSSTTANHTQAIAGPSQPISPDTNGALPMTRSSPEAHHYPLLVEHMIYRGQVCIEYCIYFFLLQ